VGIGRIEWISVETFYQELAMTGSSTSLGDYQPDDAQRQAEDIAAGEEPAPQVDVSSDYETSKEYSVSEVDKSGAGAEAAQAVSSPGLTMPETESAQLETEPTGDPNQYRRMAQEVTGPTAQTASADKLMQKVMDNRPMDKDDTDG